MIKQPEGATHKLIDSEGLQVGWAQLSPTQGMLYWRNHAGGCWMETPNKAMVSAHFEPLPKAEDNITAQRRKAFEMGYLAAVKDLHTGNIHNARKACDKYLEQEQAK